MNTSQPAIWTKKTTTVAIAIATAAVLIGLVGGIFLARFLPSSLSHTAADAAHEPPAPVATEEAFFTCGMHPHVLEHGPGACPICGMDLVPVSVDASLPDGPAANQEETSQRAEVAKTTTPRSIAEHSEGQSHTGTMATDRSTSANKSSSNPSGDRQVLFYRNPMDPTVTSPVPTKDSMGMDYVAVYADQGGTDGLSTGGVSASRSATVRIDAAMVQNMNVRTAPVERRDLSQIIRTVGYLEYDQQRMVTVTTKYSGFIEKVFVNYIGAKVRRGAPLFEIYSPELVQTEQDLLSAVQFAAQLDGAPSDAKERAEALVRSARTRLSYWDISAKQIEQLETTGEVFRTLRVTAPASGLVMKRMPGLEGMAVQPGMELFHIVDLSSLWLSVELYEDQVAWVHEGTIANIELSYFPGEAFQGSVRFLEPELSDQTRTMRAKIEVRNPTGRLRTGMYATVEFEPLLVANAIAVPTEAILRTGTRNVVVVALGNGRFQPHEVQLGHEVNGYTQK